jgi:hypothetical protein
VLILWDPTVFTPIKAKILPVFENFKFYYDSTYSLIRILKYVFKKYILTIDFKIHSTLDFKFGIKILKNWYDI